MVGLVLCAFFVLGVMTGFSSRGRAATLRITRFISTFANRLSSAVAHRDGTVADFSAALRSIGIGNRPAPAQHPAARALVEVPQEGAIAMVERGADFYALYANGELRGPVSPDAEGDLPILSGPGTENARGAALVEWTAVLVRSEAQLSRLISEMSVGDDGTAALYLDNARTEILIDVDDAPLEIARANEVLRRWRGRESMIEAIDMTTPDEAVVRLVGADASVLARRDPLRTISDRSTAPAARRIR